MTPLRVRHAWLRPSSEAATQPQNRTPGLAGSFDFSIHELLTGRADEDRWRVQPHAGPERSWTYIRHRDVATLALGAAQGWKLHVTATFWSADDVLRRIFDVLLAEPTSFKVAARHDILHRLNRGEMGPTQVGKFVTVYPINDAQAARLAARLHDATIGLRGPPVPTDRRYRTDSLVSFRYGDFTGRELTYATGATVPAIVTPEGHLIPDERGMTYACPTWTTDPFGGGSAAVVPPSPGMMIDERLLVVATLADLPRGATLLAADLRSGERRVLKTAIRDHMIDRDGEDARAYLRREAACLTALHDIAAFPTCHALIEQDGMVILEMEDFSGVRLDDHIAGLAAEGRLPDDAGVVWIGLQIAAAIETLHDRGFAHRDIKTTNVILGPDGTLRVIDFGLAHQIDGRPRGGLGTRGYRSPSPDDSPIAADIHAIGALLYAMATGAEPALAPNDLSLLDRPIELLNPRVSPALRAVIATCLIPRVRYPAVTGLTAALRDVGSKPALCTDTRFDRSQRLVDLTSPGGCLTAAKRLGDTLCAALRPDPTDGGWTDTHDLSHGTASDLGAGTAGSLLALAELVVVINDDKHRATLATGAAALAARLPRIPQMPGLYVGAAGIAAALLHAGKALGDQALIATALERGVTIAGLPHASPDLYVGSAGRLRFHLMLWEATGDRDSLRAAVDVGETLIHRAECETDGTIRWTIPPGYSHMSGKAYLGYAHGAAGIADSLLDLFAVTGDYDALETVAGVVRWLAATAVPALSDGDGLNWPDQAGRAPAGAYWCHGAGGIASFLSRAARIGHIGEAEAMAAAATRTVATATRWFDPTQCHGLSGSVECLLDRYQITRDVELLPQISIFAKVLQAFAAERDGMLTWPSEAPAAFGAEYLTGYAGIATCLLRLAAPESRGRILTIGGNRPAMVTATPVDPDAAASNQT